MYYAIENDNIMTSNSFETLSKFSKNIDVLPEDYEVGKYIAQDGVLVRNPNWEKEQEEKERQRIDNLKLTPSDVERALLKAKGMDFDDLKAFLKTKGYDDLTIKAIGVELRANDFFRGATFNGIRIVDVIGALLGYTPGDMDYLFEHKELPEAEPNIEETQEL